MYIRLLLLLPGEEIHTNDLEILSYNTLRVRTHENVQVQNSTDSHPGESGGWLQHHLYRERYLATISILTCWKNSVCVES